MFLDHVSEGAPDPVFGLQGAFAADLRAEKMSLMVGIYKDAQLKSELMPIVDQEKAADRMADYLPIDGLVEFTQQVGELCFGHDQWSKHRSKIYGAQAVGGTGALRVGAEFLAQEVGRSVWIPHPTWPNHRSILERAGCTVSTLPYYNRDLHSFDRKAYLDALQALPEKSIVLFHAACHNPTGSDPTFEDWTRISDICKERQLFPFFDMAYQGFGAGIEEDARAVRYFLEQGHEMAVAYSCSKNFSLYCQRVGALFVVCGDAAVKGRVASQVKRIIRALYSNPPAHGAFLVAQILKSPAKREIWKQELEAMRKRISSMREKLVKKLPSRFSFVKHHKGMFSYLDLDKEQVARLIEEEAVYTLDSGRINLAGLNDENIDRFIESLRRVCEL